MVFMAENLLRNLTTGPFIHEPYIVHSQTRFVCFLILIAQTISRKHLTTFATIIQLQSFQAVWPASVSFAVLLGQVEDSQSQWLSSDNAHAFF